MKQKREKSIPDKILEHYDKGYIVLSKGRLNSMEDASTFVAMSMEKFLKSTGMDEISASEYVIKSFETDAKIPETSTQMSCMNNWWYGGRQIYRFDEDLTVALESQTKDDLNISLDILEQLPCMDFFVERYVEDTQSCGFFFTIIEHFVLISEVFNGGRMESAMLDLNMGDTIKDIIMSTVKDSTIEEIPAEYREISEDELVAQIPEYAKRASEMLQYVIYLSAQNSDIEGVTSRAIIHRTAQRKISSSKKTEIANVGYRIGSAIRAAKDTPRVIYDGEHGKGAPKSPHIRRSHFHSYWVGSGENKELVVKWVNTVFVNGNKIDISTVHEVK